MRIALFGGTGNIGQRILKEALDHGHEVTAIVRNPTKVNVQNENLKVVTGDIFNPDDIVVKASGHDVVISSYGNLSGQGFVEVAHALIQGLKQCGVQRLLVVGGAGSLEVAPGIQVVETPNFPDAWKANALAQREALAVFRISDLDWTYFSPAGLIQAGERTGQYRTDTDRLVIDENGESRISYEDYAVAMLDEVENPKFIRRRFTAAY